MSTFWFCRPNDWGNDILLVQTSPTQGLITNGPLAAQLLQHADAAIRSVRLGTDDYQRADMSAALLPGGASGSFGPQARIAPGSNPVEVTYDFEGIDTSATFMRNGSISLKLSARKITRRDEELRGRTRVLIASNQVTGPRYNALCDLLIKLGVTFVVPDDRVRELVAQWGNG